MAETEKAPKRTIPNPQEAVKALDASLDRLSTVGLTAKQVVLRPEELSKCSDLSERDVVLNGDLPAGVTLKAKNIVVNGDVRGTLIAGFDSKGSVAIAESNVTTTSADGQTTVTINGVSRTSSRSTPKSGEVRVRGSLIGGSIRGNDIVVDGQVENAKVQGNSIKIRYSASSSNIGGNSIQIDYNLLNSSVSGNSIAVRADTTNSEISGNTVSIEGNLSGGSISANSVDIEGKIHQARLNCTALTYSSADGSSSLQCLSVKKR